MSFITIANATYSFESSEIISKMLDQRLFWFCGLPRAPTKSQLGNYKKMFGRETSLDFIFIVKIQITADDCDLFLIG